jgi:hypothetical protein
MPKLISRLAMMVAAASMLGIGALPKPAAALTVNIPHVKTPHVKTPHVRLPHIKLPRVKIPHVKIPHVTTPHVHV